MEEHNNLKSVENHDDNTRVEEEEAAIGATAVVGAIAMSNRSSKPSAVSPTVIANNTDDYTEDLSPNKILDKNSNDNLDSDTPISPTKIINRKINSNNDLNNLLNELEQNMKIVDKAVSTISHKIKN